MSSGPVAHASFHKEMLPEPLPPTKGEQPIASDVEKEQGWPKLWDLFSFLLPADVRETAYEPAKVDLLKDYVRRLNYRGKWATRWIHFAFFVRTMLLVLDCVRCLITHRACTFFKELIFGK